MHIVVSREIAGSELRAPLPRNWGSWQSSRRNWFIAAALVAAASGLTLGLARWQGTQDATHLRALEVFKSAYAQQCEAPELNGPLPPSVRDAYLHSRALQRTVETQSAALESGASCQQVWQALRAADFPMPPSARTIEPDSP